MVLKFLIWSLTWSSFVNRVFVPVTVPASAANAIVAVPVRLADAMSEPHIDTLIELPNSPAYLAAKTPKLLDCDPPNSE